MRCAYGASCSLRRRLRPLQSSEPVHPQERQAGSISLRVSSSVAADLLRCCKRDPNDLDTVYVLADYGQPTERLLCKGGALDVLYEFIAKHRYRGSAG